MICILKNLFFFLKLTKEILQKPIYFVIAIQIVKMFFKSNHYSSIWFGYLNTNKK